MNGFIAKNTGVPDASDAEVADSISTASYKATKTVSTNTYTLLESDNGKRLVFTNVDGCTVTCNILTSGFWCEAEQLDNNSSVSLVNGTATLEFSPSYQSSTADQYSVILIFYRTSTIASLSGQLIVA